MTRRIIERQAAQRDLAKATAYFNLDSQSLAERFVDAYNATARTLASSPELGTPYEFKRSRLKGLLWWPVDGFAKHLIFFYSHPDRIEIIRIIHGARNLPRFLR